MGVKMNEIVNSKSEENFPKDNQYMADLLKRMQYQLDAMEKKIDALMQQSKQETFKSKHFAKPYQEYDKARRPTERKYGGKRDETSSEGKFYHGRPFGKKKDGGKSHFRRHEKPFNRPSKEKRGAPLETKRKHR